MSVMEKLDALGLRVMFIPGNHDLYHKDKRTLSSIKYISKFKNIELVRLESNVKEFMEKPLRPAILAQTLHSVLKTRPPDIDRSPGSNRGPMSGGIF